MKVQKIKLLATILTAGMLMLGCSSTTVNEQQVSNKNMEKVASWKTLASPKVKKLLEKGGFEVVDTDYVKSKLSKGTKVSSKIILVDTRPLKKYNGGHVPSSYIVPDTQFEKYYSTISSLDKNKEIITFCGGWKCGKSTKVALLLKEKGWKNIKVYQSGMPAWKKSGNYIEVSLPVVKSAVKKMNALVIDTRPAKVYKKSHIPTSINIPDTKFNEFKHILPMDKNQKIIAYCGGYKCAKSHKVAKYLKKLDYKKVFVYAGGLPEWKKNGLNVEKASKKVAKKVTASNYIVVNGVQLVKEQEDNQGMVYGEFFKKVVNTPVSDIVIVDVRDTDEYKAGTIKGALNVALESMKPAQFSQEITKIANTGKKVILICASGARATEAMTAVIDNSGDTNSIFFADANIDCDVNGVCSIEVNEPL